ncbi:anthranilate synthase component II [Oceanobacillus jeddahense]|uniref:Aminodeoxychorismate/anthranilate synthase component II n=1 Tax=Oceanobacillus jeddahense TaxID=1462527 RepID=A0ABY5JVF0_9BACI|nr:aminodeoxychorismate/anthranilate synthase component II [Oceanobacillus jeddahense]UUI04066.1 aminodeoxychorismate/anthranilate synthase component II [Oceanobacillus jeddahense]
MILLIDNYDSFTYNLYQYVSECGVKVEVIRNDEVTPETIQTLEPEAIIISPGPGSPKDAGNCIQIVQAFYKQLPILGICLGHQVIMEALGGRVIQSSTIKHGKTSLIQHDRTGLFEGLNDLVEVMRYHSLAAEQISVPSELRITATAIDDDEIMGVAHQAFPVYGLQFHPESIGTLDGKRIISHFVEMLAKQKEEVTQ